MRSGHGYDVHRLAQGRRCIIGGVDIPHRTGLAGHSDVQISSFCSNASATAISSGVVILMFS